MILVKNLIIYSKNIRNLMHSNDNKSNSIVRTPPFVKGGGLEFSKIGNKGGEACQNLVKKGEVFKKGEIDLKRGGLEFFEYKSIEENNYKPKIHF